MADVARDNNAGCRHVTRGDIDVPCAAVDVTGVRVQSTGQAEADYFNLGEVAVSGVPAGQLFFNFAVGWLVEFFFLERVRVNAGFLLKL